jgi:CubicO group peptidase (beta-lactamase class C family)
MQQCSDTEERKKILFCLPNSIAKTSVMKKYVMLLLVAFFVQSAFAQKLTNSESPEAAGFSSERLKRIDDNMNEWVKKGWMNGAVGMIVRNGKIGYYKSAGYNDLDAKTPLPKDDIFRIASQTKAITSVAVMMLYEEGKFLLEDPVSKYIPSFAHEQVLDKFNKADTTFTTVPAKRDITIRDLLTHTSGIDYAGIGSKEAKAIYAKSNLTPGLDVHDDKLSDAMNRLGKLPLLHQPGEKWTYGLSIDLLGYLVEIWSGISLDEFLRKRIFEPLGMNDSYFNIPKEKVNRLAKIYMEDSLGHLVDPAGEVLNIDPNYPLRTKTYFSGGGGLSSTIYDYAIFLQMLLNGGEYNGKRILSRNTVRMMTTNQIGDVDFGNNKFGLGFAIVTEKSSGESPSQVGTFSWGGAFATSYWVDPKEKMIVQFYRQLWGTTHGDLANKFKVLAYSALKD